MKPLNEKQKAMLISCGVEVSSFALNLVGALLANSLTLWTNTMRVGLDSLTTLFGYYVTNRIAKNKSDKFDYGLGKWENLSALINVLVMLATLSFIGWLAFHTIKNPHPVDGTGVGLIVLAGFLVLNVWLLLRFWRLQKRDSSPVVYSQFVLYRNASAGSLLSFIAVAASACFKGSIWETWADVIGSLLLAAIIFYGVTTLLRQSLAALLDEALDESLQLRIMHAVADSFSDYRQFYGVRTRRSGKKIFIEMFFEFEPELTVGEMLARSGHIKKLVENLVPQAEAVIIPCSGPPSSFAGT